MSTVTSPPTSATNISMTLQSSTRLNSLNRSTTARSASSSCTRGPVNANPSHELNMHMNTMSPILELPGPFVVLQGVPGDGMANTIDSMPALPEEEFHSSSQQQPNSHNAGNSRATQQSNSIPEEEQATNLDMDIVLGRRGHSDSLRGPNPNASWSLEGSHSEVSSSLHASHLSIPSDLHISHPLGLDHEGEDAEPPSRSLSVMTADLCLYEEEEERRRADDSLVRVDSETSSLEVVQMPPSSPPRTLQSSSSHVIIEAPSSDTATPIVTTQDSAAVNTSTVPPSAHQTAAREALLPTTEPQVPIQNIIPSEGGLHLPLPSSTVGLSVIGMGYNSILPPARSSSPSRRHPPINATQRPPLHQQRSSSDTVAQSNQQQRHEPDAFVLVSDSMHLSPTPPHSNNHGGNNGTLIHPSQETHHHQQVHESSGSTSSSLSNSISNVHTDILPSHNPEYMNLSLAERSAIINWNRQCRTSEKRDWKETNYQRRSSSGVKESSPSSQSWWKSRRTGCLLVFESIPTILSEGDGGVGSSLSIDSSSSYSVQTGPVLGELPPGSTVLATAMHTIPNTWPTVYVLEIESPLVGYVLYSNGSEGYSYLAPGLPSQYVMPEIWSWRVCCPEGAFVRSGLELTSQQVDTVPYGNFVRVVRKTINGMGLSRLKIEAVLGMEQAFNQIPAEVGDRDDSSSVGTLGASTCHGEDIGAEEEDQNQQTRVIRGWISEALNPLSGESGFIVQPCPFPVPALYRVILPEGAVIRDHVELSSAQIGHAPQGTILTIVGRAYSQHPMDQCIERLRLAGGGGWVSVRLNQPAPRDRLVLEMIGIDGTFDPKEPGLYHLKKQKEVLEEFQSAAGSDTGREETERNERINEAIRAMRRQNTGISSINDDEEGDTVADLANSGEISNTCSSITVATSSVVPTLYRSGVATGGSVGSNRKLCGSKDQADEKCLICLTENRSATIVHGETGHIACCLTCARILKSRGDKCPVCRLPIETIIQQFWA